ncbi:uncharacterized protein LOC141659202 [Apium graveolens]|uniref:uncharacterized protein LOC141659202 n=1 Tax=Apium graveolens TaxID=4045 RepID=UPI003D79CE01
MAHVNELLKSGYREEEIDIKELKPHYFSQRAWNSLCAYWGTPRFETRSKNGKRARKMVEFTSCTGAKSFDQRREEIDAEREARGEDPIGKEEFLGTVYDPSEPVVKNLQEKMKTLLAAKAESPELSSGDQPPSPRTRKEIRRKKELEVLIQAKPPNKGIIFLHPCETLPELIGAEKASQWISREMSRNSQVRASVPDEICLRMVKILDEMKEMVQSLPMREVKQSVLDENVRNLAAAAFSDPSQHVLQAYYAHAAISLLPLVLKDNDKIIAEESLVEKDTAVDGTKAVKVDDMDDFENEDPLAHMYPLL